MQGVGRAAGLADHFRARQRAVREQAAQAQARQVFIVDDQHTQPVHLESRSLQGNGTASRTRKRPSSFMPDWNSACPPYVTGDHFVLAGEVGGSIASVPPTNLGEPDNIDFFKRQLLYYRCTAYDHDIADVLGKALKWVAARAPQVARPAIVLDIDETSLFNWPRIYQQGYAFFIKDGDTRVIV